MATTETAPPPTGAIPESFAKAAREIPTTFTESFKSWWASNDKEAAISEERILSRLPFFVPSLGAGGVKPVATDTITASLSLVQLSGNKRYLNTLSILPTSPAEDSSPSTASSSGTPPATVLLPGYGAGIGFFFLNYPSLGSWVRKTRSPVFAVDWLGMGRSARVPFSIKSKREDTAGRVTEAENFFLDALEEWREKQGLETMTLVGHSLGAYLSTAYALRHPTRVSRLILLSPAGVPRDPDTMNAAEELTTSDPALDSSGSGSDDARARPEKPSFSQIRRKGEEVQTKKRQESNMRKLGTYLWEAGWSPFQVVRSTLFWGPMLVGKYSARRFAHLPEEDLKDMHDYIWHITRAKGSGEYCISHILAPGAHARMPLVDRVDKLKVPVSFVYGDHDWMDPTGGEKSVENMKKAGNHDGRMYIIKGAGHHVYLDNPEAVNSLVLRELERVARSRTTST